MSLKSPKETAILLKKQEEFVAQFLKDRHEVLMLQTLSLASGQNLAEIGPPGWGKSMSGYLRAELMTFQNFFIQYTPFTTIDEVVGSRDIMKMKEGKNILNCKNFLPNSPLGHHDEIGRANAVKNKLLKLINEGKYSHDGIEINRPKIADWTYTNTELLDKADEALNDRFVLKVFVGEIYNKKILIEMAKNQKRIIAKVIPQELMVNFEDIMELRAYINTPDIFEAFFSDEISDMLYTLRERVQEKCGVKISGRTWIASWDILAYHAFLQGRDEVIEEDFEILQYVYLNELKQQSKVLSEILKVMNPQRNTIESKFRTIREKISEWESLPNRDDKTVEVASQITEILEKELETMKIKPKNNQLYDDLYQSCLIQFKPLNNAARILKGN